MKLNSIQSYDITFAKKNTENTSQANLPIYLREVSDCPELIAMYEKNKDIELTDEITQTTGQREISFNIKERNCQTSWVFIDGKLTNCSRTYKKSDLEKTNFDYFTRETTLYTLGTTERQGEQGYYLNDMIQVLNDESGQPNRIVKTTTNLINNSANTQVFYLEDYDESFDVLSAVKLGKIKPRYETTTLTFDKKTNSLTTKEVYSSKEATTTKISTKTPTGWSIDLEIKDNDGNILYSTQKSYKKLSKNESLTTINGRNFLLKFKNDCGDFYINDEFFTSFIRGIEDDYFLYEFFGTEPSENAHLLEYVKTELPADFAILLKNYQSYLDYTKNPLDSLFQGIFGDIKVSCNIGIIAHELGHMIDSLSPTKGACCSAISENETLIEIYKKELENFEKSHSRKVHDLTIPYFGKTGGFTILGKSHAGLSELIAETMAIVSTPNLNHKAVAIRTHYLMMYFPKTIAYIANLIEEKNKICFDKVNS